MKKKIVWQTIEEEDINKNARGLQHTDKHTHTQNHIMYIYNAWIHVEFMDDLSQ